MKREIDFLTSFGTEQHEFNEFACRANIIRRELEAFESTQYQETLDVQEAAQVAEKIEQIARYAITCDETDLVDCMSMIIALRNELQQRIDNLNIPNIGSAV